MLPDALTLEVVTPERRAVHERVDEVQLPGTQGYLGILPGHAPLITELGTGELSYRKGHNVLYAVVVHGYAEVLPDRVIVLAERAERAEEIDVNRARAALDRAEKRLAKRDAADVDWNRATLALERALVRLQVASKGGAVAAAHDDHRHAAP